jgi:hypothetical protein
MLYVTKPKDHVREMKGLAKSLHPYTPPRHPKDDDISWLKTREVIVDGIPMVVHYSESDHGDIIPAVLTIGCKNAPFIPFAVVCKVARMFLGTENLTLFEYTKGGSKIYSWMVLLNKGIPVGNHHTDKADKESYNGFDFFRVETNNEQEVTSDTVE